MPGMGTRRLDTAIPERIDPDSREAANLRGRLQMIISRFDRLTEIPIDRKAKLHFGRWYTRIERSVHSKRLDTYGHRLMVLLAVNDGKDTVDLATARKAITLCNWQLMVRKLHDPIDADTAIARLEQKIPRILAAKGEVTRSRLYNLANAGKVGMWPFETALKNLERNDIIRMRKKRVVLAGQKK